MKKLYSAILGAMLCIACNAQTNAPATVVDTNAPPSLPEHVTTWLSFLSNTSTNWVVAPYAIYVDDDVNSYGGGLGVFYKLSDYTLAGMRMDYVNNELWMPSANIQLQLPIRVADKLTVAPFAISGVATPISGRGDDNGEAVGIIGAGLAVKIAKNIGLVYDAEIWSRFSGTQHRFGVYYRF